MEHLGIRRDPETGRLIIEINKERKPVPDPVVQTTLDELNKPYMGLSKRTQQAESILTMLSSMGGMVAGGGQAINSLMQGRGLGQTVKDVEHTIDKFTYKPRTEHGQLALESIANHPAIDRFQ